MVAIEVLERPALVLNRNWIAIQTTTVKEAIGLVAKGSARIIEPETYATHDLVTWDDVSRAKARFGDAVIRSARLAIAPPEVILLTAYRALACIEGRAPYNVPSLSRPSGAASSVGRAADS